MSRQSKQRACFACADAKRSCDRLLPFCTRCIDREVNCTYPPARSRQHNRVPDQGTVVPWLSLQANDIWMTSMYQAEDQANVPELQNSGFISPAPPTNPTGTLDVLSFSSLVECTSTTVPALTVGHIPSPSGDPASFLHPSAWTVTYTCQPPIAILSSAVFSNFIRGLQAWLFRFLRSGHNPFIHRHLYSKCDMPECMRDAYAAIAVSQNTTRGNENIIDNVCFAWIANLLARQPLSSPTQLSIREHLARTQSLLIHILLSLFSSSIPRRAKAEDLVDILLHWADQLFEAAVQEATAPLLSRDSFSSPDGGSIFASNLTSDMHEKFILSESIRRTCLLSHFATGVYFSHKGDWSSTCCGDIGITARAELWDATAAAHWDAIIHQKDPLFVYSLQSQWLMVRAVRALEVDEFARHLFTVIWGLDKVEEWIVRTGDAISFTY